MRHPTRLVLALALLGLGGVGLTAADWPQWRGPDRSGVSPEKGLLATWPKEGPKLVWTFTAGGLGYTSPSVVGGVVYTMGARGKDEYLIAVDSSGKEKWATKVGPRLVIPANQWSYGPNSAPTVSGDLVYGLSSAGVLIAVNKADGKQAWRKDLPKEIDAEVDNPGGGNEKEGWGYCWSPVVEGDKLICTPGGPKGLFAALDLKSGKVLWRSAAVKDRSTYGSPIVATIAGVRQAVTVVQNGLVSVSVEDGKLLWEDRRSDPFGDVVCAIPIVSGNQVYLSVGYSGGAQLLTISNKGGKLTAREEYKKQEIGNKQGGVVLIGKHLYGYHEDLSWACQEWATGNLAWGGKRAGRGELKSGAVVAADGKLYVLVEGGSNKAKAATEVGMLETTPTGYKELARFTLPRASKYRLNRVGDANLVSGRVWTHPVIADGKLYLRDQELLFCYQIK